MARGGRRGLAAVVAVLASSCADARCRTSVLRADRSPDGRRDAVVFVRTCGRPLDYTTEVSVVPYRRKPGGQGNVFSADSDLGRSPPAGHGGPRVDVGGLDARTLEIRYEARARVLRREPRHDGTSVRYVQGLPERQR